MKAVPLKVLGIAMLALSLAGCVSESVTAHLPQELQAILPVISRVDHAPPSVSAPNGSAEAAIQEVILRGNSQQEQAIASHDSSPMRDTSTDSYYQEVAQANQDMVAHGITRISLVKLDWGDVIVNGNTAVATSWETWTTDYAHAGTDQSRDRNVYSLVQENGVWKIQSDDHPDDPFGTPVGVQPAAPAPAPEAPPSAVLPRGRGGSANWAGYSASGGSFTGVTGSWIVPQPASDGTSGADATWVGIGGERSRDLIQAGTEQTVTSSGRVRYYAWIEMLPDYARPVPLSVHPGDSVTVSINQQETGTWLVLVRNNTTGATYDRQVQYRSTLSSAEWIEEAPSSVRGALLPIDNFGSVTFTGASAVKDGQTVSLAEAGASPIAMITARGQTLATPSVLADDGAGFTVTRTSTPAATGGSTAPRNRRSGS